MGESKRSARSGAASATARTVRLSIVSVARRTYSSEKMVSWSDGDMRPVLVRLAAAASAARR